MYTKSLTDLFVRLCPFVDGQSWLSVTSVRLSVCLFTNGHVRVSVSITSYEDSAIR